MAELLEPTQIKWRKHWEKSPFFSLTGKNSRAEMPPHQGGIATLNTRITSASTPSEMEKIPSGQYLEVRYRSHETPPKFEFHVHAFYEIYCFIEGPIESYAVDNRIYKLRRGDILIIPPATFHVPIYSQQKKKYTRYFLWVSPCHVDQFIRLDPKLSHAFTLQNEHKEYCIRCPNTAVREYMEEILKRMWDETQSDRECKKAALYSLYLEFLVMLNRMIAGNKIVAAQSEHQDSLFEKLIIYVQENFTAPITLASAAELFFVSPSTIELLFTQNMQKPFYRYITECRIVYAQTLILNGVPLASVGERCGYNDYSTFYKAFTRILGISPSEYKQRQPPNFIRAARFGSYSYSDGA